MRQYIVVFMETRKSTNFRGSKTPVYARNHTKFEGTGLETTVVTFVTLDYGIENVMGNYYTS